MDATEEKFDAVYIDPMFEKPKRSAKSPKPMQLLQLLLKDEVVDTEELLRQAVKSGIPRAVVKLPLKATTIGRPKFSMKGQSIRYDVYLIS